MLTPAFELSQTDTFLKIKIKAPYAKVPETEIFVEDSDFKFYSKPYFLRLTLPGNITEDGQESAEYNADKGEFFLSFSKQNPGEMFEGLDMITKLLAPKGTKTASQPLIEVIDNELEETEPNSSVNDADTTVEILPEEEFDWCIEQTPYNENTSQLLTGAKYGFANQKTGVFQRLQEELSDIVDCPDPDNMEPSQRREMRLAAENNKFDAEHYLGDYLEDDMIQPLLDFKPSWSVNCKVDKNGSSIETEVDLTDEEKDVMRKLPNKEYLLDDNEEIAVYLSLVDLIFAYAYNNRFTEGENNVEAGWNISKLSATLSWFEVYSSLHAVVVTSYRRCLCYPLYRNWKFCEKVLEDVTQIFKLGRRCLLKCLLDVRKLLLDTDSRYILNDLYVTDYCVWIQQSKISKLQSLYDALLKIEISKDDIDLNLLELEQLAVSAIDNDDLDSVTEGISELKVDKSRDSDDDSSESEEEESSSESSDESSEISDTEDAINVVKKEEKAVVSDREIGSETAFKRNEASTESVSEDRPIVEISDIGSEDLSKSSKCSNARNVLIECISDMDYEKEATTINDEATTNVLIQNVNNKELNKI